jgi:tetratricopeptide (TPR) repeat protein
MSARRLPFWLGALLLTCAALALYWAGLRFPLVFDDGHVTQYALGDARISGVRWLSQSSFAWIRSAFGGDAIWQRLANILLHGATAALLFGFLLRLLEAVFPSGRTRWLAFFGAALFVLHPVAVYSVAYLVQRSIVLATVLSVACLWLVLEGLLRRSARWYWAAAAAYVLALSSKEHAVMVPAVAAAMAVLVRGWSADLLKRLALPLALLAAVGLVAVLQSRRLIGAAYEPFAFDVLGADGGLAYPLSILNQATLFFRYLGTWIVPWPGWMSIDVRTAFPADLLGWPHTAGFVAWLAYAAGSVWLLTRGGRLGLLGFGLLWPWLLSLTEISAVRAQEPFVLYRSYLWMSGLPVAFAAALAGFSIRVQAGVFAIACLAFAGAAHERLRTFSSPMLLWEDAIRKNDPALPLAQRAYVARGTLHLDARRMEEAGRDFETALKINPSWPDALLARGTWHLRSGRAKEALADLNRAIELDPKYAAAYGKRCVVARELADCRRAVALNPNDAESWINLGAVLHSLKRLDEAQASLERALRIAPSDPSAHYNYGVLLMALGRRDISVLRHIERGCDGGIPDACDIVRRSRRVR